MNSIEKAIEKSLDDSVDSVEAVEAVETNGLESEEFSSNSIANLDLGVAEQVNAPIGKSENRDSGTSDPNLHFHLRRQKFEEIDDYLSGTDGSTDCEQTELITEGSTRLIVPYSAPPKYIELPLEDLDAKGCISLNDPRSQIAEEYRHIKRPVISNFRNLDCENTNVIMVASSVEGEGKTFTALNLALSMGMERNRTVLLIDTDPAKASLSTMLGFPSNTPGLMDYLSGDERRFSNILHHTNIDNLRVVPVGTNNKHATELLASDDMQMLVSELSQRYKDRVIILDSPPLIPTTESKVIAGLAGQIVFVVEATRTGQTTVTEALSYVDKDKYVGLVLNKSRYKNMPGYGYAYNYGKNSSRAGLRG